MTARNLINLLNQLEAIEAETEAIEAAWDENPESEELEAAFDASYQAEHAKLIELANALHEYTSRKLTKNEARRLVSDVKRRRAVRVILSAA